jgi:hypothetical protein
MNRRVALLTALSAAGTVVVGSVSFAIVYRPVDEQAASIPLLEPSETVETTVVDWPGTSGPVGGGPFEPNPAAPIVASSDGLPVGTAGTVGATVQPATTGSPSAAPAPAAPASPVSVLTTAPASGPTVTAAAPATTAPKAPSTTAAPVTTQATPAPATTTAPTVTSPVTTQAPTPTTAAPAPTASTAAPRPEGVPSDWPANKPIPPMPANCRDPQLEDNGVWNCQH